MYCTYFSWGKGTFPENDTYYSLLSNKLNMWGNIFWTRFWGSNLGCDLYAGATYTRSFTVLAKNRDQQVLLVDAGGVGGHTAVDAALVKSRRIRRETPPAVADADPTGQRAAALHHDHTCSVSHINVSTHRHARASCLRVGISLTSPKYSSWYGGEVVFATETRSR